MFSNLMSARIIYYYVYIIYYPQIKNKMISSVFCLNIFVFNHVGSDEQWTKAMELHSSYHIRLRMYVCKSRLVEVTKLHLNLIS